MYTGIDKNGKMFDFTYFDKGLELVQGLGLGYERTELEPVKPIKFNIIFASIAYIPAAICAGIMKLMGFKI